MITKKLEIDKCDSKRAYYTYFEKILAHFQFPEFHSGVTLILNSIYSHSAYSHLTI